MSGDPFDDDDARVAEQAATAARRAARERDDWRWLLGDPRGRRIVWSLLEGAGVFRSSFSAGQSDQTAFNEGGRNTGLRILTHVMEADADAFLTMQRDARESFTP